MKTIIFQNAKLIVGLALILLEIPAFSQSDSIKANLSFDLGLTRDRNFNLWPVFKSFKSPEKKELQILYPIFSKNINYSLHSRHFHFFPFLIFDSSKTGTDKRLLSFYYPSVFHVQKQHLTNSSINSYKFIELAPYISLFGISRTSSGMLIENNTLFFIWYKNDILSNKIRLTVFPLYWYFSKKDETTRLFLPIYYRKTSPFHDHLNFVLIYDYRKSPYSKRYVLFPILWSSDFY